MTRMIFKASDLANTVNFSVGTGGTAGAPGAAGAAGGNGGIGGNTTFDTTKVIAGGGGGGIGGAITGAAGGGGGGASAALLEAQQEVMLSQSMGGIQRPDRSLWDRLTPNSDDPLRGTKWGVAGGAALGAIGGLPGAAVGHLLPAREVRN